MSSVEVICGHEELQTEVSWNVHVGYAGIVSMFLIIVEIFNYFFKHDAA